MADKKRVLIVTQEMNPYTSLTQISKIARQLPQHLQENGMEIRILMPRFGTINERRHRLHEVVRLSGMNIIVDDDDYPLMIKVASLPGARMQVYFLDNEDFFKRKHVFDKDGKPFEDNPDRMAFFCKGVIETVKKFGWSPDITHCLGWMTSLVPAYLRTAYANEPLFQDTKIVYSAFESPLEETFTSSFFDKAVINNLEASSLDAYKNGDAIQLNKGAASFSDALIIGDESIQVEGVECPTITHNEDSFLADYLNFYQELITAEQEA